MGGLEDPLCGLSVKLPDLSIVIGDDKAAPPGDFPINFSIILDLKDDLVGVVDPAGKGAVGLGVLVLGVVPVDEGVGNVTSLRNELLCQLFRALR